MRICADYDELQQLGSAWQALASAQRTPLLEHAWFSACATCLHADDTLNVMVQQDDGGAITAIAPLVRVERDNGCWLEFLGSGQLYEPSGILFDSPAAAAALYRSIAASRFPILLHRLPAERGVTGVAPQRRVQSGLWMRAACAGTAVLDLRDGWDKFYSTLSSQRRYDHRRAARRAAAIGEVGFEVFAPDAQEAPDLLDRAFAIEDQSWKGQQGSSLLRRPRLESFFRKYGGAAAAAGTLRLYFLTIDEAPVAMALCIEKYDALWFLKIGYDETYAKCSPGMLQLMHIIEHCCNTGVLTIEHLGSFEPWLAAWTSRIQPRATWVHYPRNLSGARLLAGDVARVARSRIASKTGRKARNQNIKHA